MKIDFDDLVTGAIGGIAALILRESYNPIKRKLFSNRPRLEIEVDLRNPMTFTPMEGKVRITYKGRIYAINKSSIDAYNVWLLFPRKTKSFEVEVGSVNLNLIAPGIKQFMLCSTTIVIDSDSFNRLRENDALHSLNPLEKLKFGMGYTDASNYSFFSIWSTGKCSQKRFKPWFWRSVRLKDLINPGA